MIPYKHILGNTRLTDYEEINKSVISNSFSTDLRNNRKYKDPMAQYHLKS